MAFISATPPLRSIVLPSSTGNKLYSTRAFRMGAARGESLKNGIRTGAGVLGAVLALTLPRNPILAATPPLQSQITAQSFTTTSPSMSSRAVLVVRTSPNDITSTQSPSSKQVHASPAILTDDEFLLSIRLCAACAIGVYIASMASNLREVMVTLLASCISTIYSLAAIANIAPSFYAPFLFGFGSLLFSFVYYAMQTPVGFYSTRLRRRLLSKSGFIASAAGAGSACATGQALLAVVFYLLALEMSKSRDRTRRKYRINTTIFSRRNSRGKNEMVPVHAMVNRFHTSSPTSR